jgi:hypothetical protein
MMLRYAAKFALDILPSLVATVLGAYIVNHYMVSSPGTVSPVATAMSAILKSDSRADVGVAPETVKINAKASEIKASETSDVSNIPEPGVKAKGISEKAILERSAVERPREPVQEKLPEKAAEKPVDKPAETAIIPLDARRHQPPPAREKSAVRTAPVAAQPGAVAPAPNTAAPVEAAVAPEERRDVNDLARAAIERLRGGNEGSPRPQEAARVQEPPRIEAPRIEAPRVAAAPAVQPLPPPIVVATPSGESFDQPTGSSQTRPGTTARLDDPLRPTPPANIPPLRPLDLRADATEPVARRPTVADDMLSAAKSVFQAVLPK